MHISVIEDDTLESISNDFRKQYPFLKLRFYKSSHRKGEGCAATQELPVSASLEESTMFHCAANIEIGPERTVTEVERDFFRQLGLSVQIFRRSGKLWIQTIDTDHWTLQMQNDKGCEYSLPYKQDIDVTS